MIILLTNLYNRNKRNTQQKVRNSFKILTISDINNLLSKTQPFIIMNQTLEIKSIQIKKVTI